MDDSVGELRERRSRKLRSVWESIGFNRVSGNVLALELATTTLETNLRRLRAEFNA